MQLDAWGYYCNGRRALNDKLEACWSLVRKLLGSTAREEKTLGTASENAPSMHAYAAFMLPTPTGSPFTPGPVASLPTKRTPHAGDMHCGVGQIWAPLQPFRGVEPSHGLVPGRR
jgi:hypothetical protein